MLQSFRHARDKSAMLPTLLGCNLGFAVRPRVVLAEEFAESTIEVRHGQFGPTANGATLEMVYGEVDGAPAVFSTNLPLGGINATPEPGSMALLGTGVLGLVGFVRRRFPMF